MVKRFVEALFGQQRSQAPQPVADPDVSPPGAAAAVGPEAIATQGNGSSASDSSDSEISGIAVSLASLRAELRRAGGVLPTILTSRINQICDLLHTVLTTAEQQGASTEQRYLLNAMITDYLPSPMRSFLALPETDREDASRSTTVFSDQLGILEETIRDLLNQVRIGAIEELSTHGRFLAEKFAAPSLRLDAR